VLSVSVVGVVIHPVRPVGGPLEAVRRWAAAHDVRIVQVPGAGPGREVAEIGEAAECDLLVSIGGDGTTLAAIHAGFGEGVPVLGVACGTLGVLTSVAGNRVGDALDRFFRGDWIARRLPALAVERDTGQTRIAFNDVTVVRAGEGQVRVIAHVDGILFGRFAGDGCIVSAPVGSSAYALAAGGPLFAAGTSGLLLSPLSPHGGSVPRLVIGHDSTVRIDTEVGHAGARLEIDGQVIDRHVGSFTVTWRPDVATVVNFTDSEPLLTRLRRLGIITDSPRILAEDSRGS
jgi:NAD+ kinase